MPEVLKPIGATKSERERSDAVAVVAPTARPNLLLGREACELLDQKCRRAIGGTNLIAERSLAATVSDVVNPVIEPVALIDDQQSSLGTFVELTSADLTAFNGLGVSLELLVQAGVHRVTDREAREKYGITGSASRDMSGIVFPYFSIATGARVTARVRRDNPEIEDGKEKNKYISAYGDRKHLYFPPGAADKLQSPDTPIVLVEAEKSSLALTAWAERTEQNLLAVAMGGCWGWRGRIGKQENSRGERVNEMGTISDLSYCDGRKVHVLLDATSRLIPRCNKHAPR